MLPYSTARLQVPYNLAVVTHA